MTRAGRGSPLLLAAAALVAVALMLVVVACGPGAVVTPGPVGSSSLVPAASASPVPSAVPGDATPLVSPVTGLLVDIDATGLTKVSAFTLRTADGAQTTFRVGVLENGAEFPPGHLAEHMAASSPIRVFFRDEAGTPVVYRIEDAE